MHDSSDSIDPEHPCLVECISEDPECCWLHLLVSFSRLLLLSFYFIMDPMDDSPPFLPLPLSGRGTYMGLEQCGVCECLGTQLHLVDSFFT